MRGSAAFRVAVAPGGALAGPWVQNSLWTAARAVPSLDLRFADNKSLTDAVTGASLVTFTRASTGTFVGSDGLIKSAVTNLLLRSEEFDNASWTKTRSSVTADAITAPNGTTTADTLIEDSSASATHFISQGVSITSGTNYAFSVFIKRASGSRNANLRWSGGVASGNMTVDLATGAVTASAAIQNPSATAFSNGWWRVTFWQAATSTGTFGPQIFLHDGTTITYTGDGTSGLFLWGAQLEQSSTVGEYIPTTSAINSAPRFDHNPTTGESLGLLVEEARTNSIRNNTMVGAVAGTPGTVPTNYTLTSGGGVTREIVGVGTESGITYIDVRFSAASGINFFIIPEPSTQVAALSGQSWTSSFYARVVGGSLTNLVIDHNLQENSVAGTFLAATITQFTPTTAALVSQRYSITRTLNNALTAFVQPYLRGVASGAYDITLRIGLPQLEQGAFATSVIPTSTATVTRAADVASITGSNFSSFYNQTEGTVFADASTQQSAAGHVLAGVSTGGFADSAYLAKENTNFLVAAPNSAPSNLSIQLSTVSSNVGLRAALAFTAGTGSASAVMNGGTVGTDASTGIPITMSQMAIGSAPWSIGAALWNGTIKRLTYWPVRLANPTLQQITQP